MRRVGYSRKSPELVLKDLSVLGEARATYWASARTWDQQRLYCRVKGSTFQASMGGGLSITSAICVGNVVGYEGGSQVEVHISLGFFPAWSARAAYLCGLVTALMAIAMFSASLPLVVVGLSAGVGVAISTFLWERADSVQYVLRRLSEQAGGISWRRPRSAA